MKTQKDDDASLDSVESFFSKHHWINSPSVSGPGSDNIQTKTIQEKIPLLIQKYNINTFFDIPCGDFYWMKNIVNQIPNYSGADIVSTIINNNKKNYPSYNFIHFDLLKDIIPNQPDLIFCRDLLVHFPLEHIKVALNNIKKSSCPFLLMTTFINRQNNDIKFGEWQPVSFFDDPFNFPEPLEMINEKCIQGYPNYVDKSLALWKVSDIPHFLIDHETLTNSQFYNCSE